MWRYCNSNDYKIKDGLNVFTSQTESIVSTAVVQIITVIAVKTSRQYNVDMLS